MANSEHDSRLIRLHRNDNVVVAAQPILPGETLILDGREVTLSARVSVGSKLASCPLRAGEKILKYGAPIGSATRDIAPGETVHLHNMQSDYLPTRTTTHESGSSPPTEPSHELASTRRPGGAAVEPPDELLYAHTLREGEINGYQRADGRKGIRNILVVAYLVECAHHVAREIAIPFREQGAHLIGFGGCYPNAYAARMMRQLCTHPNVGGALLVSLGCESFNREQLAQAVRASARPVQTLVIQQAGGTRKTIEAGRAWVEAALRELAVVPRAPMGWDELVVGTICGGSDGTSGITANPAIGRAFDGLVRQRATAIFEETGELIGCEHIMAERALTPELGQELIRAVEKAARYYTVLGHGSFAVGNAEGGLTTQEEKSLGAYSKSGASPIAGLIKPGDVPPRGGLYLLDMIPDGEVRFGFPNINDNAEIAELIACGAHLILFSTGRGSVVGSAIAPVVKVCANPETYRRLSEDMDVDAGRILEGKATLEEVGQEVFSCILKTATGWPTTSEALGHQEFILSYKFFAPAGPDCLPVVALPSAV